MEGVDGLSSALQTLLSEFLLFLPKLLAALFIFLVGIYLANVVTGLVRKALERRRVNAEVTKVITQVTRWALMLLVAVTALQQVDFNLTAFITGLGIIGFTIGFALKDISENFVAGMMLLLQRPFELGDVVEIEDFRGRVTDVSLRATEMQTLDGQNVILPNGLVYTSPIINYTRSPLSRIALDVGVGYDSDLEQVRQVAVETVSALPTVLDQPAPYVVFKSFGESSIDLTVFYWIDDRETPQFRASDLALPALKEAFAREGIDIPYPIRTVQLPQPQT
jgi:small conductance mechanosensitive channel